MTTYNFEQIMAQTRQLAADYRMATGQSLPVTIELARFDAVTLLKLKELKDADSEAILIEDGVEKIVQIKGRVIFPGGKSRQRVGQLNLKAEWDYTILVIYNDHYQPDAIFSASREVIEQALDDSPNNKRGSMTVAKFKAIGEQVWPTDTASD
ncbi:hypothetical protein [Pleionea litopenaei]|uniref:Uncharacterized protein n=1 Tax=Pleionea litopenaei TaxID=3070815 RepID=A0AA51RVE7_9GAMM|nr:hypothetical protein [Pleionea sp. HL-JVS1]WMS88168.1 hypothetical protein Q9312_04445 [Pleionea sp. HL-JVS1]